MTHDIGFHAIEMVPAGLLCRLDAVGCEFDECPCKCHTNAAADATYEESPRSRAAFAGEYP